MPGFSGRKFTYEEGPIFGSEFIPGNTSPENTSPENTSLGNTNDKVYLWYKNVDIDLCIQKYKWVRMDLKNGFLHCWIDEIHQNGPAICHGADNIN